MTRRALLATAGACLIGMATAHAQQSCIVKLDVPYDFDDGLGPPYQGTPANSTSTVLRAWQDNYAFPAPLRTQRSPDYVQTALSPTNVSPGPNSTDANGGFTAMYAAAAPANADGFWLNYDFSSEPGLTATGGDVTVRYDYAPGHWHGNGNNALNVWIADADTEVRAFVGDGAAYAGQPLGGGNPFFGANTAVNRDVRRLTGAYAGQDDADSDGWPDMPEVSGTAPGTSWRTETIRTELAASREVYVGITGFGPGDANARRAVFVDAVRVLVTSRETDLAITASGPSGPVVASDEAEFTVTITNEGGSDEDPVVQVDLPAGFSVRGPVAGLENAQWSVGPLAIGQSRTLVIPVTVDAAGPHGDLFLAEIARDGPGQGGAGQGGAGQGGSDDCDSQPLNDSGTEDDEARVPVTVADRTIGGIVFLDEGQGGTAYDGVRDAPEAAVPGASVTVRDAGTGEVLFETITNAAGAWFVPNGDRLADRAVTVTATPIQGTQAVSEAPARTTGSVTDGVIALTVPAGETIAGIDFGLLREPSLLQDRLGTIAPGDTRYLSHRYRASGSGAVTFTLAEQPGSSDADYEGTLLRDADCDGLPGAFAPINGPVTVGTEEEVCLLIQVAAAASAPEGSGVTFTLGADTAFGATGVSARATNTDRLTLTRGALIALTKEVCNLGEGPCDYDGAGFVGSNVARPGQILRYRLRFESVGEDDVDLVTVRDVTPAFTSLVAGTVVAHRSPAGAPCAVDRGAAEPAGYTGELRWSCAGTIAPGADGVVGFDVSVDE